MSLISVVSVTWNSHDFADLMVNSLVRHTRADFEIVIYDNSDSINPYSNKNAIVVGGDGINVGHGEGLNRALNYINGEYVLILDIDCHSLTNEWQKCFIKQDADVVVPAGPPQKPIRPACMFFKRSLLKIHSDFRATPGYQGHRITPEGCDVGITWYHEMMAQGVNFRFMESFANRYGTITGEEWGLDGIPLFYHHWHGASVGLACRQADYPNCNLMNERRKLFDGVRKDYVKKIFL